MRSAGRFPFPVSAVFSRCSASSGWSVLSLQKNYGPQCNAVELSRFCVRRSLWLEEGCEGKVRQVTQPPRFAGAYRRRMVNARLTSLGQEEDSSGTPVGEPALVSPARPTFASLARASPEPRCLVRELRGKSRCVPDVQYSFLLLLPHRLLSGLRAYSAFSSSAAADEKERNRQAPKRAARFKKITEEDISYFQSLLGDGTCGSPRVILPPDTAAFSSELTKVYSLKSSCALVLQPANVKELQEVLRYCYRECIAVVPQGGNTGLVGGGIPVFDEVIISTLRMREILHFDSDTGALTCEAGCVLETLQQFVEDRGFSFPLDLGAKGSCTIGGNVSSNAGGLRMIRFGSLAGNVLGLEAVLADGSLFSSMTPWKKDNTGFKLHQLFLGAEGLLGVVSKVVVNCPRKCDASQLCLFQCDSFENVTKAATECKKQLGEVLSAIEFFDALSLQIVLDRIPSARPPPLSSTPTDDKAAPPFYLLVETLSHDAESSGQRLEALIDNMLENDLVTDGVMAENETQKRELWTLREAINPAMASLGKVFKYDVTMPFAKMYSLVSHAKERLRERGLVLQSVASSSQATESESSASSSLQTRDSERTAEGELVDRTAAEGLPARDDRGFVQAPAGEGGGTRRRSPDDDEGVCHSRSSATECPREERKEEPKKKQRQAGGEQATSSGAGVIDASADVVCVGYGHLGDCNVHLNVLVRNSGKEDEICEALEPWVYQFVSNSGGSISSEHGMGQRKASMISLCKDKVFLNLMKKVKAAFDEKGILNPYKVYRDEEEEQKGNS